jgi:hypothetical protein
MTEAVRTVLAAFDALSPAERQEVTAEILRRAATDGDTLEADMLAAADELFRGYDAEEAARGGP